MKREANSRDAAPLCWLSWSERVGIVCYGPHIRTPASLDMGNPSGLFGFIPSTNQTKVGSCFSALAPSTSHVLMGPV